MAKQYVSWGGFRVRHKGVDTGAGRIVAFGRLCGGTPADTDPKVQIFHVPGYGYTYAMLP